MVRKAYEYEEKEFPDRVYFWNPNRFELYNVNNMYGVNACVLNNKNKQKEFRLRSINNNINEFMQFHVHKADITYYNRYYNHK